MAKNSDAQLGSRLQAAIFDVDGTLCDVRPVRKYVVQSEPAPGFKKDFDRFHRESLECKPFMTVKVCAQTLCAEGLKILIVSGREARWTKLTIQWLDRWEIPFDGIYMRPSKDFRPDVRVKEEIGAEILREYDPVIAFDDRNDIIEVWQNLHIPTIRVGRNGAIDRLELIRASAAHPEMRAAADRAMAI